MVAHLKCIIILAVLKGRVSGGIILGTTVKLWIYFKASMPMIKKNFVPLCIIKLPSSTKISVGNNVTLQRRTDLMLSVNIYWK